MKTISSIDVNYRRKVTMPIRDMWTDDFPVMFCVDIYGVRPKDLAIIPGGSAPMIRAVKRLGLDTSRYQAVIWDIPL